MTFKGASHTDIGENSSPAEERASAEPTAGMRLTSLRKRRGCGAGEQNSSEREWGMPWAPRPCKDLACIQSEEGAEHKGLGLTGFNGIPLVSRKRQE